MGQNLSPEPRVDTYIFTDPGTQLGHLFISSLVTDYDFKLAQIAFVYYRSLNSATRFQCKALKEMQRVQAIEIRNKNI